MEEIKTYLGPDRFLEDHRLVEAATCIAYCLKNLDPSEPDIDA